MEKTRSHTKVTVAVRKGAMNYKTMTSWKSIICVSISLLCLTPHCSAGYGIRPNKLVQDLNGIIIPELNYHEAKPSDIFSFLSDESRTLDPERVGVNILWEGKIDETNAVTISVRNMPLVDAVKYVCQLAGLSYRIETNAVIISKTATAASSTTEPRRAVLDKLLRATEADDYDSFVADGDPVFKATLTKQMVEGVSRQLSPRMKNGYQCSYLGELSQHGCRVLLWKLVFKDGGDDTLAKLVLKDGMVAGFWLQ